MNRRKLREHVFKLLFRAEFNKPEEMEEQIQLYCEELTDAEPEDGEYIGKRCADILLHLEEIDGRLEEAAQGWSLNRIGKVELTIMRLALYEIEYDDNIPTGVAINEAVELAKSFGQDDASSFVNGILAKVV